MPCYHPNKVKKFADGTTYFLGGKYFEFRDSVAGRRIHWNLPGVYKGSDGEEKYRLVNVPCGKCAGCRLDQSREWAARCVLESKMYPPDRSWFVTLTYDDEDPAFQKDCKVNDLGFRNLYPRHAQLFIKSLREKWARVYGDDNIRVFYCGEYGDSGHRCHFHFLLFNLGFYDLEFWARNRLGDPMFNSAALSSVWPHGFAVVAEVNYQTCAYTARYVMKKRRQGDVDYESAGIEPEFTRMSLRPGIGIPFYDRFGEEILCDGKIYLSGSDGKALVVGLPRIFLNRAKTDFPQLYADYVAKRESMFDVSSRAFLRSLSSFDEREYWSAKELEFNQKFRALKRNLF